MTFSDNFNRADGALGDPWTVVQGSVTISGNKAVGSNNVSQAVVPGNAGAQTATIVCGGTGDIYQQTAGAVVKSTGAQDTGYTGCVRDYGFGHQLRVYRGNKISGTNLLNVTKEGGLSFPATISLTYSGGTLTLTVNASETETVEDTTYSAGAYSGVEIDPEGQWVDSIQTDYDEPPYLTLSPTTVYALNPASYLSATLHNDTWDGPFPNGGTLSADHGVILTGYQQSTTLTTFSYNALGYVGLVTITDSETGAQGTFTTTAHPVPENGDSWPISEDGAGILDRTGDDCPEGTLLSTCTPIDQEGTVNIPKGIDAIIEQLGGYFGQVGADIGAVSIPAQTLALFERPVLNPYWTAEDMVGSLGGSPTVYSNADLMTALGNLPAATYQPVLDALVALQGDDPPTLAQIGTMISDLATISGYTLQDVRDWIEAIPTVDLSGIEDKLDAIQPSTDYNLSTLTTKANTIGIDVGAVLTAFGLLTTDGAISLATIIDAISALSDLVQSQQTIVPPVWPSLDQVTLGTPVAFDGNVDVTATMDGVLVNLTQSPTKTGKYMLGNVDLWYGLGRISFESDNGDVEPWQYLAFDNGIFVPKTMQHAAAVHLQVLGGAEGTVTPWTITAPEPAPAVATVEYPYPTDDDDPAGG